VEEPGSQRLRSKAARRDIDAQVHLVKFESVAPLECMEATQMVGGMRRITASFDNCGYYIFMVAGVALCPTTLKRRNYIGA
jgi:hypothetical protein